MTTLIPKTVNTEQTYRNDVPYYKDDYYYRYLDLPKLIDLVQSKSITFPSLSSMEDRNEGSSYIRIIIEHLLKTSNLKEEKRKKDEDDLKTEEDKIDFLKSETFCSCWHQNTYESAFHWKTYGNKGFAIRIKTSDMIQFIYTLEEEHIIYNSEVFEYPDISYGRMMYHHFSSIEDLKPFNNPYFVKEQSFLFEQEFRILLQFKSKSENANNHKSKDSRDIVKISFSENEWFNFEIYAHPEMPDWEISTLNNLDIFKENPIKQSTVFRKGK